MKQQINTWIDQHQEELIESLCNLIACPSVRTESTNQSEPFGSGVNDALLYMMKQGDVHGFYSKNLDGYAGYLDYSKEELPEMMGIMTHLDVVPVNADWSTDPFTGTIIGDKLYGRGTSDNKGPTIASLFALRALKEAGFVPSKNIRLILGCDEESGMSCVAHYCKHARIPDFSISPDASYPLVNSEKNIYHSYYTAKFSSTITIECGTRVNIVPATATATIPLSAEVIETCISEHMASIEFTYTLTPNENGSTLIVHGTSCHSAIPHMGKNALLGLISALRLLPLSDNDIQALSALNDAFGLEWNGKLLGLDIEDESGFLTCNPGVMHWDENGYELQVDMRAPLSVDDTIIEAKLVPALEKGFAVKDPRTAFSKGLYTSEDTTLVKTLLKVYRDYTGDMHPPLKIGGGTYARKLPNAVAFGADFPNDIGVAHMPNEYIGIEKLILNAKILANAIYELTK